MHCWRLYSNPLACCYSGLRLLWGWWTLLSWAWARAGAQQVSGGTGLANVVPSDCTTVPGFSCSTLWTILKCNPDLQRTYNYLEKYSKDVGLGASDALSRPGNLLTLFVHKEYLASSSPAAAPGVNPRKVSISALYGMLPGNYSREDLVESGAVDTVLGELTGNVLDLRFSEENGQLLVFSGGTDPATVVETLLACNGVIHVLDQPLIWSPSEEVEQEVQLLEQVANWTLIGTFSYEADCGRTTNDMLEDLARLADKEVVFDHGWWDFYRQLLTQNPLLTQGVSFTWFVPLDYNTTGGDPKDAWANALDPSLAASLTAAHLVAGSHCPLQLLAARQLETILGQLSDTNITLSFTEGFMGQVMVSAVDGNGTILRQATVKKVYTICQSVIYVIDKVLTPGLRPSLNKKGHELFPYLAGLNHERRIPTRCSNILTVAPSLAEPLPDSAMPDVRTVMLVNITCSSPLPIPVNGTRALQRATRALLRELTADDDYEVMDIPAVEVELGPDAEDAAPLAMSGTLMVDISSRHNSALDILQQGIHGGEFLRLLNLEGVPATSVYMYAWREAATDLANSTSDAVTAAMQDTMLVEASQNQKNPTSVSWTAPPSQYSPPPPTPEVGGGSSVSVVAITVPLSVTIALLLVVGAVCAVVIRRRSHASETSNQEDDMKGSAQCVLENVVFKRNSMGALSSRTQDSRDASSFTSRAAAVTSLVWHAPSGTDHMLVQPAGDKAGNFTTTVSVEPTGKCQVALSQLLDSVENSWLVQNEHLSFTRKIGTGSFGDVYLGEWRGTPVAIKSILLDDGVEADNVQLLNALKALHNEMSILAQCRHPNIVLFLGVCVSPLCCITEFCAKGSLYSIIKRSQQEPVLRQQLNWHRRLSMALDAAMGMSFLHSRSPPVVHRDLKSPNLLVDKNWRVKVADFGLSYIVDPTVVASTILAMNPRWLAPEVVTNTFFTTASDAYSFGIVLWELLTLQTPFLSTTTFRILYMVAQGDHPEIPNEEDVPDGAFPGLSEYIALMKQCWSSDPQQRPAFEEILTRLRDILRGYERWLAANRSLKKIQVQESGPCEQAVMPPSPLQEGSESRLPLLNQMCPSPPDVATPESMSKV